MQAAAFWGDTIFRRRVHNQHNPRYTTRLTFRQMSRFGIVKRRVIPALRESMMPSMNHRASGKRSQRPALRALAAASGAAARHAWIPALALCGMLVGSAPAQQPAATRPAAGATTRPLSVTAGSPDDSLEGHLIIRVEVANNTRTDARMILDQVRSQAGQLYSRAAVDQDLRTIAAMERFVSVRAEIVPTTDGRIVVRFVVQERALVTAVEIVGNHRKNDTQVREVMQTHPGMGVDLFVIQTDITAIENLYKKDGYNFVKVSVDQKLLEEQGTARFTIEEGPKSRIWHVKFDGNASLKSDFLKWKIQTKSYIWIFRKGVLDEDKIESDINTIRDVYVSKGWLDARVSRSIEYSPDKKRITVRFVINEGPHYKVGTVTISGNKVFSTADIRSDMALQPGDFVERNRAEASRRHIEDRYGHEGYIYQKVTLNTTYADQPGIANISVEITEGLPYAAGRIIVRGNPEVQDRVVRRQIRIYPDQTYDTVLVRKSIDRLKATRLFTDVKVTPIGGSEPVGDQPGVRDALVEVQEGQSGRFLIGAGVSTNSGVVGQLSLEQQNFDITNTPNSLGEFFRGQSFKGAGQYFQILLEPGTEFQRYRVTFQEPYLFDSPYSFGNDAYYFTRKRESWNERRIGDIVTLGRRFGDIWSVSTAFRVEDVNISGVQYYGGVPGDAVLLTGADGLQQLYGNTAREIYEERGEHLLTSIKPGITRDTTDSRVFPTSGSRASLSWEQYGAMGGDVDMSKVVARFDWYYPLYTDIFDRKTVFVNRNEVGVVPFGDSVFYERFYGGGIGSLRAFKFRGISPRSGILDDPVGGDFSWISTGEVNYPIYEELLRGVVFIDVGTVERDIEINEIRSDIGLGFRITIPFFGQLPLAIDFGYPMTKAKGDRTQIISFSLGIPF